MINFTSCCLKVMVNIEEILFMKDAFEKMVKCKLLFKYFFLHEKVFIFNLMFLALLGPVFKTLKVAFFFLLTHKN